MVLLLNYRYGLTLRMSRAKTETLTSIYVHVFSEQFLHHLDLLLPSLQVVQRLLYSKLYGPCWVAHVVDDHVHEYPVRVYLDQQLVDLLLQHHVLKKISRAHCHQFVVLCLFQFQRHCSLRMYFTVRQYWDVESHIINQVLSFM